VVDSVAVFDPGYRVTDANGAPVNNAKIKFFEVGGVTPKTVYGAADLGAPSALGTVVRTRSDGYPVIAALSNTTTLIYVGSTAYYIVITDENDVPIFPAKDNVKGAVDTSTFLAVGSTSTLAIAQTSTAIDLTLDATHNGKLISCNAALTITLTAAATLGSTWNAIVRNDTVSSAVSISAAQNIATPMGTTKAFVLRPGATAWISCNGATFEVLADSSAHLMGVVSVLSIVDRVSAVPVGPAAGARYIATAVFLATPVTTAVGDIIEATGQGTWFKVTPDNVNSNVGWLAYVRSESRLYEYISGAWTCLQATSAQAKAGTDDVAFMTALQVRNALPVRAYAEYAASEDITTVLPWDDTIPQNTEGVLKLSATVTPKSVNSRFRIRCCGMADVSASIPACMALFQDNIANALQATGNVGLGTNGTHPLVLEFEHSPGTTSPVTYKINIGPGSAGTLRMNGTTGGRKFGGVGITTLVVEEVITGSS